MKCHIMRHFIRVFTVYKIRVKESSVSNEPVNKMLVHYVNCERSDEPARPRSLVRAFARIHDTVFVLKQLKEDAFNHCCLLNSRSRWIMHLFVCLFCCFTSQSTAMVMGGGGKVSSPNHLFSWASLNKRLILQFRYRKSKIIKRAGAAI